MTLDEIVAEYESNVADLSTSERTLVRAAYETGLRHAQELAKEHVRVQIEVGSRARYTVAFRDFDAVIDAEAKKG